MKLKMIKHIIYIFLFLICLSQNVFALSGLELAQQVYDRDDGDDAYFKTEMLLIDKNGHERRRIVESYVKDFDGLMKTYLEFLTPPDIKGTKFLSWEHHDSDDTQYLYFPELGRSRRIVSSQKKLRFVNTDFTYEDMQRRKPFEDTHHILESSIYLERKVYVLESLPISDNSQYGKRISLIDIESFVPVSIDYFNKKGRKVKEFRVLQLEKVDNIWTGMRVEMYDLKAGHKTQMNILDVNYNQGVKSLVFEVRNLEQ